MSLHDTSPCTVLKLIFPDHKIGCIIGLRGQVVKQLREESGANIKISDGYFKTERLVEITGTLEMIVKAIKLICHQLEEDVVGENNRKQMQGIPQPPITLRLIVPISQCGSLIGKAGSKIMEMRDITGASITPSCDILPNSTEREIIVSGTSQAITDSVSKICCSMLESPAKGTSIPYRPKPQIGGSIIIAGGQAYTVKGDSAFSATSCNVAPFSGHLAALSLTGLPRVGYAPTANTREQKAPLSGHLATFDRNRLPKFQLIPTANDASANSLGDVTVASTEVEKEPVSEAKPVKKSKTTNHQLNGLELEKKEKYQAALQEFFDGKHYGDVIRVIAHAHAMKPEWLFKFFTWLSSDLVLQCLRAMLHADTERNLSICVQVAIAQHYHLPTVALIEIFESNECYEGLFLFLASVIESNDDLDVNYYYIVAACKTGRMKELERFCRESSCYDAHKVKTFLMRSNMTHQLPLIRVCDRFDFVKDLIFYLYGNGFQQEIKAYVQQVNPSRLPFVIGCLLDMDCDDEIVESLVMSLHGNFSTQELVHEVEKRNRLKVLLPWLEMKSTEMNIIFETWNKIQKEIMSTQGIVPTCDYSCFGVQ